MIWRDAAITHLTADLTREACGLVIISKGRERYRPCRNLSQDQDFFVLDPSDWAAAEDVGEITAIVHSHPFSGPQASQADLIACERSGLPWHIYSPHLNQWNDICPSGYKAPLIGREWVWSISDCWTLARDWYAEEFDLQLRDWKRPLSLDDFNAAPMFDDCWESTGFVTIPFEKLQRGDLVLMAVEHNKLNHCGVYLGDQMILHHVRGRLSSRDVFGGYYLKSTGRTLRHNSRME